MLNIPAKTRKNVLSANGLRMGDQPRSLLTWVWSTTKWREVSSNGKGTHKDVMPRYSLVRYESIGVQVNTWHLSNEQVKKLFVNKSNNVLDQLNINGICGVESKKEIKNLFNQRSYYISGSGDFLYDPFPEPSLFLLKVATSGLEQWDCILT